MKDFCLKHPNFAWQELRLIRAKAFPLLYLCRAHDIVVEGTTLKVFSYDDVKQRFRPPLRRAYALRVEPRSRVYATIINLPIYLEVTISKHEPGLLVGTITNLGHLLHALELPPHPVVNTL